jgi:HK97 gp10 family phage protein
MATCEIAGDREIRRALKALEAQARGNALAAAMAEAMRPVLGAAHEHAPRDTGNLDFHLGLEVRGAGTGRPIVEVAVEGVPYAGVEEFGSEREHHPAGHFMLKALDEEGAAAVRTAAKSVRDNLERAARGT